MEWLYHTVRHLPVHWRYWALLAGLLGEDAGLPVPGETVPVFTGFLAHRGSGLHLVWIILIGNAAATKGDNIGFFLRRKLEPRLIGWLQKVSRLDDEDIAVAKDQLQRHRAITVFWARFVFGLRVVADPLAGMLGVNWKQFLVFNALGAATWVTTMGLLGVAWVCIRRSIPQLIDLLRKSLLDFIGCRIYSRLLQLAT